MENRVRAVATMLDNRLISSSFDKLEPQMDELMTPVEIVQVDFLLNGKPVYGHRVATAIVRRGVRISIVK